MSGFSLKRTSGETAALGGGFNAMFIIKAVLFSYAVSAALLVLCALAATYACLSDRAIGVMVNIVTAVATVMCGFLSGRRSNKGGLLCGALCGSVYTVLLCVLGGLVFRDFRLGASALTALAIGVLCGGVGGIMGINTKKARRR